MKIVFGTQDAKHRSAPVSSQRMINCYAETPPSQSRAQVPIIASYGVLEFASIEAPLAALELNGLVYIATPSTLYSVKSNGAIDTLGTFPDVISSPVIIDGDGTNIVITSGTKGYVYTSGTLSAITDTDFPAPQWMGFLDGYFPIIEQDSGRIWVNETPYSPTSWNPLDFATAEGNPDNLVWGIVEKREVFLFGRKSTEVFYNSGNADFPLSRAGNGFFETGIMSTGAACKLSEGVFFMGHDGIAYQLNGYSPQRISTHPIEQEIEGHTKECKCLAWKEGGHAFVGFNFPEKCHVYDLSTGLWSSRRTYGQDNWKNRFCIEAFDKTLVGWSTLGYLDPDTFTEYGDTLRCQCTSAAITNANNKIQHDFLELVFETGNDGTVMLRFSDDGGRTWSRERSASLGALGEYKTRARFNRLGTSRDRVYEYSISDPYRRTLVSATLNEYD